MTDTFSCGGRSLAYGPPVTSRYASGFTWRRIRNSQSPKSRGAIEPWL
ncbi:hypothetical protein [Nitrosomonas sp. Is37]|nr:hypothetical protein [Nitrosomonas sp. Is37]MDV6345035.1 hypothetical protein [Nitrosomonas sp. Is37]